MYKALKPKFEPHESHQTLGMNSGKVFNSCNTNGTRRGTLVTSLLIFWSGLLDHDVAFILEC